MADKEPKFNEEGLSTFEPIRVYDMPGVLLNQILSGQSSAETAIRTLSDSASLTPRERQSLSGRIKDLEQRNNDG